MIYWLNIERRMSSCLAIDGGMRRFIWETLDLLLGGLNELRSKDLPQQNSWRGGVCFLFRQTQIIYVGFILKEFNYKIKIKKHQMFSCPCAFKRPVGHQWNNSETPERRDSRTQHQRALSKVLLSANWTENSSFHSKTFSRHARCCQDHGTQRNSNIWLGKKKILKQKRPRQNNRRRNTHQAGRQISIKVQSRNEFIACDDYKLMWWLHMIVDEGPPPHPPTPSAFFPNLCEPGGYLQIRNLGFGEQELRRSSHRSSVMFQVFRLQRGLIPDSCPFPGA